jgi:FtsH-binding integral membrane protein
MKLRALQVVLALVGLLFVAAAYLVVAFIRQEPALAMMASVYATLGVFLWLAVRNPSAHRSLIAFTAWSSLAHASLMAVQSYYKMILRGELVGVGLFAVIGVVLIALAPAKERRSRPAMASD